MTEVEKRKGESIEKALRKFKTLLRRDGVFDEIRKREFYEKPSESRRKQDEQARRREQKKTAKRFLMGFVFRLKTLDKYIALELMGPFFVGICGFLMVMITDLLFTFTDLIINKGVPFIAVLRLLIYKLPSILVLTFPVATLFATAMALGRLSSNNEIVALRTSGTGLWRIGRPIFIFSLVISLFSFFINEKLVPHANKISEEIIRQVILKKPLLQVRENVFFRDSHDRFYYVKKVNEQENSLEGIMVYELDNSPYPRVILGEKGWFKDLVWDLRQGKIHRFDKDGFLQYESTFDSMQIHVNQDILRTTASRTTQEMDRRELGKLIEDLKKSGASTAALLVDLYMKYSVPLTCFVFALVGVPLSLSGVRSGRTWGMVLSIVLMFTFYVFASVFRSLGRGEIIPPFWAAWGPQFLFGSWGWLLLFVKNLK